MAKILHISKYYTPYFGGIEDVAQTIVKWLKPGNEQLVICFNDKNHTQEDYIDGVKILRVATIGNYFSQPIPINYTSCLKKTINSFKPDYIHLHLPNPIVSLLLMKIDIGNSKLYIHWHADIANHGFTYCLYRSYEKKILFRADRIFATSQLYLDHSAPLSSFKHKTYIIPNTVSEQKFASKDEDSAKIKEIQDKFGNKKILFFIGRHVPYKGIEYLIKADKLIKEDCVFVIAGKGKLTNKLTALASGRDRIHFIGRLTNDQLRQYLRASYLFVFPSINRGEAFGVALAEALYNGLPAVSFNIIGSGVSWVNKHEYTGLVVENKNVNALADSISRLLKDESLHSKFKANATKWVKENFVPDQALKSLSSLYTPKEYNNSSKTNVSIVIYNDDFENVKMLVDTLRKSSHVLNIYLIDNSKNIEPRYNELDAIYIFNDKNLGFGRAHNIALKESLLNKMTELHLIMNADISFMPSVIDELVDYMVKNKTIGALMPKVYYPNNKIQYLCRILPTPADLFSRRFIHKRFIKERIARLEMRSFSYDRQINVPHISGCFMFLRNEVLEKSGLFDERYFLYLEDVDLTRRVYKYSKTIFYPDVHIIHEHKRGSYNNINLLMKHIVSACKYFNKWGWFRDKERDIINDKILKQINN